MKKLLTTKQVANVISLHIGEAITQKAVERLCRSGKLKAIKLLKVWRINKDDLNDFLTAK